MDSDILAFMQELDSAIAARDAAHRFIAVT